MYLRNSKSFIPTQAVPIPRGRPQGRPGALESPGGAQGRPNPPGAPPGAPSGDLRSPGVPDFLPSCAIWSNLTHPRRL